jgi:periplasmic divalent cation tolerance protein
MKKKFIIIETTFPNLSAAKKLSRILLQENLAACVQFSLVESHYLWLEKIAKNREILVRIKSENALYKKIEKIIVKHHSYEVPQIFKIQINQGFKPYLNWIESNLKNPK